MTPATPKPAYKPTQARRASHERSPGLDEVPGLIEAMGHALAPLTLALKDQAYWASDLAPSPTEYKSRDGFIPYAHNKGGLELALHVPKCEEYDWGFLGFGECDECGKTQDAKGNLLQCGYQGQECALESDGHLDAFMRIWLKFEGLDEEGRLSFYLVMEGGNNDAPYFRSKHLPTLFERSFTCRTVAGFQRAAAPHIRALLVQVQS